MKMLLGLTMGGLGRIQLRKAGQALFASPVSSYWFEQEANVNTHAKQSIGRRRTGRQGRRSSVCRFCQRGCRSLKQSRCHPQNPCLSIYIAD